MILTLNTNITYKCVRNCFNPKSFSLFTLYQKPPLWTSAPYDIYNMIYTNRPNLSLQCYICSVISVKSQMLQCWRHWQCFFECCNSGRGFLFPPMRKWKWGFLSFKRHNFHWLYIMFNVYCIYLSIYCACWFIASKSSYYFCCFINQHFLMQAKTANDNDEDADDIMISASTWWPRHSRLAGFHTRAQGFWESLPWNKQ